MPAVLLATAALVRVLFLLSTRDRAFPFSIFYYGDSRIYREYALALLAGRPFDQGIPYHPPLLAWIVAATIAMVGERPMLLRAALAVPAALVVPLTYLLARRLRDRGTALLAAGLTTFSFGLCVMAVSANSETVYIPLLIGQALATVALVDRLAAGTGGAARLAAANGLLLGLASLTRAEHLAFFGLVPLAIWIGAPRAAPRARVLGGATAVATGLALVLPWSIASHRRLAAYDAARPPTEHLSTWVLVSNAGPLNFAVANRPDAGPGFDPTPLVGRGGGGHLDLSDSPTLELYRHGYRVGLGHVAADPARALILAGRKIGRFLAGAGLGFGASDVPAGLEGARPPVDVIIPPNRGMLACLLLALAALGAFMGRHAWRRGAIVLMILLHKVAVTAAFYGYARFFVQISPLTLALAAVPVAAAAARLPARPRRAMTLLGWALAAVLLLELAGRAAAPRGFTASGSSDAAGKIIQDAEVRLTPR